MESFEILEVNKGVGLKTLCVGIGNAGCNAIAHMADKAISKVNLIAINTDSESLNQIDGVTKIFIGSKLLKATESDQVKEAVMEHYDEIKDVFQGADIVFILAGLGGGTGTIASLIIIQIAKDVGALTIPIVTIPFKCEGRQRLMFAQNGLDNIKQERDFLIVIQNDKYLPTIVDKKLSLVDAYKIIDIAIENVIKGILGVIISSGENDINIDFDDLKVIIEYGGTAFVGSGEDNGNDSEIEALQYAIKDSSLKFNLIDKVAGFLIHFVMHPDFPLIKIAEAMDFIYEHANDEADIVWGITRDKRLNKNYVKATILLAGLDKKNYKKIAVNNMDYKK